MDAGEDICGGISAIQDANHIGEYIVTRKLQRTKILTVRKNPGNQQENRHTQPQREDQPVIFGAVVLLQQKICYRNKNVEKPHNVGNDEVFAEWNQLIDLRVYYVVRTDIPMLQIEEAGKVENAVQEYRDQPFYIIR